MARRAWADKVIETYQCGPCRGKVHVEEVAKLLTNQHARAVRIIKKRKRAAYFDKHSMNADQFDAYIAALDDVYSDITKGRA